MRCPNCLYDNHEQAESCERCGEPLHGENRLFNTCRNCGYINEAGAEYCESCGEPMTPSGYRKSARKKFFKKQAKAKMARSRPSGEGCSSGFFLLILIFVALVLLGLIQSSNVFKPAQVAEPETLLVLQGTSDLGIADGSNLDGFSALATDPAGVERMSLYVDGELVGAQNFSGANQAVYQPGLNNLTAGGHEVFVRSINTDGKTAYSQIVTVDVPAGGSGAFALASDPQGLPVPADIRLNSLDDGKRISVSWESTGAETGGVRIYARLPGSAGLVHLVDLDGTSTQFDFATSQASGKWEVYLAYLSSEGYEGELGYQSLAIGVAEGNEAATPVVLPEPTHVHLVIRASDCQQAASQLGDVRDVYYKTCVAEVNEGRHSFLVWDWPLKWQDGSLYTYADILGFELKLVLTNSDGTVVGERVSTIPFDEIRGTLRTSQDVNCGIQRSWYVRAVGQGVYSDWAYAGSIAAENCDIAEQIGDGCVGQADGIVMSGIPEGFMPEIFFQTACEGIDLCYSEGTIGQPKVGCDNLYHANLLALCSQNSAEVDYGTCQKMAEAFYKYANLYGAQYYPLTPSFANCLEADKVTECFKGNLGDAASQSGDKVRAAALWVGKAAWTGVNRFGEGALWVIDWGIAAVGSILPE